MNPFFHSVPMIGTIILMVLKIGGYIDAPWWMIFIPISLPFIFLSAILILLGVVYMLNKLVGERL